MSDDYSRYKNTVIHEDKSFSCLLDEIKKYVYMAIAVVYLVVGGYIYKYHRDIKRIEQTISVSPNHFVVFQYDTVFFISENGTDSCYIVNDGTRRK